MKHPPRGMARSTGASSISRQSDLKMTLSYDADLFGLPFGNAKRERTHAMVRHVLLDLIQLRDGRDYIILRRR